MQQQQGVSLTTLIHQVLDSCHSDRSIKTLDRLNELMSKKNLEPKKIGEHIFNYFTHLQSDFKLTYSILMDLMKQLILIQGRDHFKLHIFTGFERYFNTLEIKDQEREEAYRNHELVDDGVISQYLKLFVNQELRLKHKDQILEKVDKYIESQEFQKFKRALKILSILGLKKQRDITEIVQQIKRYVSTLRFGEIMFYFNKADVGSYTELTEQLSFMRRKEADKIAVDILEKYKLDVNLYPQLLFNLEKRGISYNYREYPLYFCEEKFRQSPRYLAHLVLLLFDDNKLSIALSLIEKYKLHHIDCLQDIIPDLKYTKSKTIVNVLRDYDDFGATQLRVLKTTEENYLELIDFGLEEESVIWVDNQTNNLERAIDSILKAEMLGFDSENSGGIHTLQGNANEILQVATPKQVFIFDIPALQKNESFIGLLKTIFYQNEGQIIIGHACSGDQKVISSLTKSERKMKNILDTQKLFKQEGKGAVSLKDLIKRVYQRSFSKYEQCSGWTNRPLRRAQLHYAALDAFVLIKIYNKQGLVLTEALDRKGDREN